MHRGGHGWRRVGGDRRPTPSPSAPYGCAPPGAVGGRPRGMVSRPVSAVEEPQVADEGARGVEEERPRGVSVVVWLTTADHKRIGTFYLVSALVFSAVGGAPAVGFHAAFPVQQWLGAEGMPRRYADHLASDGSTALNTAAQTGSFLLRRRSSTASGGRRGTGSGSTPTTPGGTGVRRNRELLPAAPQLPLAAADTFRVPAFDLHPRRSGSRTSGRTSAPPRCLAGGERRGPSARARRRCRHRLGRRPVSARALRPPRRR